MKVVGNSARQHENFNGVSEKLKQELIKQVKPGEVIRFQLLHGSYDPSLKREVFGSSKAIRLSDKIYDPYAIEKKGEKGEIEYSAAYVDIGVPDTIKDGRVERCKKYWVESIANGIPGNGQFSFIGGNINDMEIVEFLCLSNGNAGNSHRDKSNIAKYEIVDSAQIRKNQEDKDYKELEARLKLLSKQNPEKAAELSKLIPKEKIKDTAPV